MKTYHITLLLFLCSAFLVKCASDLFTESEGGIEFYIGCNECAMSAEGGSFKIYFETQGKPWELKMSNGEGMRVTQSDEDSLLISYLPNPSIEQRIVYLHFTIAQETSAVIRGITLLQEGRAPFIVSPSDSIKVLPPSGDTTLIITSRVGDWKVKAMPKIDWLRLKKLDEERLRIIYTSNESRGPRFATITLYASSVESNTVEQTLSFVQARR